MLNYEVLAGIYTWRKDHKLDEWREFCQWIEQLPYSEIITASPEEKKEITGWRPISEYDRKNYDWVLVKCFDGPYECVPTVAEMRNDGLWYGEDGTLPFEPRYFFDMQQLDGKESEEKVTVDKSDIVGTLKTAVEMLHLHGYNLLGDEIAKIEKLFKESEG